MWRREYGCQLKSKIKFILAANRDEVFWRPAKEAHFWQDHPHVLAGRDLTEGVSGGTWIGLTKHGKLSFLTNIMGEGTGVDPTKKGRGALTSNFLTNANVSVKDYCDDVETDRLSYRKFNLVCGNLRRDEFIYMNSVDETSSVPIQTGSFCMSNGTLDSKWYKVERNRHKFQQLVDDNLSNENADNEALIENLLTFLEDTERHFPDPNVTVNNPMNEYISSIFVPLHRDLQYGTRTNTIIMVDQDNHVTFLERTKENLDDPVTEWRRSLFSFDLE